MKLSGRLVGVEMIGIEHVWPEFILSDIFLRVLLFAVIIFLALSLTPHVARLIIVIKIRREQQRINNLIQTFIDLNGDEHEEEDSENELD